MVSSSLFLLTYCNYYRLFNMFPWVSLYEPVHGVIMFSHDYILVLHKEARTLYIYGRLDIFLYTLRENWLRMSYTIRLDLDLQLCLSGYVCLFSVARRGKLPLGYR